MSKIQRVALFAISLALLFFIFFLWQGRLVPNSTHATIIFTALLMISFVTLFLEHWFTKPTDVLAASISIMVLLAPLRQELTDWGIWYIVFFTYNFLVAMAALLALLLLNAEKSSGSLQNTASYHLKNFATTFGNGRLLYYSLFIISLLFYVDSQSSYFLILFAYSVLILLAEPKRFVLNIIKTKSSQSDDIGEIFGVQSRNTFLVKLYKERKPVRRFEFVEFRYSMEDVGRVRKGLIVDNYFLNQQQWIKVLATPQIASTVGAAPKHEKIEANVVYKLAAENTEKLLNRFVGLVIDDSNIRSLRFEYGSRVPVAEGTLLEVQVGAVSILYQIVQGVTDIEVLESKNEAGLIVGQAAQLGIWNADNLCFDRFGWLPEVNSPVYLAEKIEQTDPPESEFLVGNIPETNYPVLLNKKDAITHHLAILGVTGTGKSVFARNLIRQLAKDGTKIICVDFTNEYSKKFVDLKAKPLVALNPSAAMFKAIGTLISEKAKYLDKQDASKIADAESELTKNFGDAIGRFLKSEEKIAIFELPDVSNTTGILDYTKWFFKMLFQIARTDSNYGKQVCVVLEEAHTVVPEWNFVGADDRGAQALVNSISQIALQGRKYNIGFMIIAQRTANVSKTVLTQCNSIIAFQQFDKTSADFLTNYMGSDMVEALPTLKPRQAIAVGKAFRSGAPSIFQVPEIAEPAIDEAPAPEPKITLI